MHPTTENAFQSNLFKTSLRAWRANYLASKAAKQGEASEGQATPLGNTSPPKTARRFRGGVRK